MVDCNVRWRLSVHTVPLDLAKPVILARLVVMGLIVSRVYHNAVRKIESLANVVGRLHLVCKERNVSCASQEIAIQLISVSITQTTVRSQNRVVVISIHPPCIMARKTLAQP